MVKEEKSLRDTMNTLNFTIIASELFFYCYLLIFSNFSYQLIIPSLGLNFFSFSCSRSKRVLPSLHCFNKFVLLSFQCYLSPNEHTASGLFILQLFCLLILSLENYRLSSLKKKKSKVHRNHKALVNALFSQRNLLFAIINEDFKVIKASKDFLAAFENFDPAKLEYRSKEPNDEIRNIKSDLKDLFSRDYHGFRIELIAICSRFYQCDCNKIKLNGQNVVLLNFRDVQSSVDLEGQQAESKMKTEILRTVSHELRTPVNSIMNMISIVSQSSLNAEDKEKLSIASCTCHHLLSLVNDLLDYSQVKAGCLRIAKTLFAIRMLIKEVADLVRYQASMKSLKVTTKISDSVPEKIFTDPFRLKQILLNLLNNAIKFTKSGSIEILVSRSGKFLRFACKDSGLGINPDKLSSIFSMFSKDEDFQDINPQGVGLGLYISNILALQLGPQCIHVESVMGQGSEFSFLLDYLNSSAQLSITEEIPEEVCEIHLPDSSPTKIFSHPTLCRRIKHTRSNTQIIENKIILIADDSCFNVMVFKQMLQHEGITANAVFNGSDALQEITEHDGRYDCILLDCEMPVLNGWDTAQKLKIMKEKGEIRFLPIIIATTAYCDEEVVERCHNAGMDDILVKPCAKAELIQKIEYWAKTSKYNSVS